ncbi:hypothetical protein SAMN05192561_1128 [Halopenitus malekzadehii]|uniref:Uncharacterized protein n=1 Tax=Halopenitus malekzadehii TaxID=1267564 RepID=A0A1H6JE55_9EURY|nr:hypothetical protein [Halopenitus malekzadehii]SEH60501.1 hypothetical protein SAMN05192561_1128 [Halopenitus malekzadehii]
MIENYDDKNREQTLAAVAGFSADRLAAFIAFEREHKDRTTVVKPLERKLVTVTPTGDRRYVAGIWFDGPSETATVRRRTRVERALENGRLQEV